MSLLRNLLLLLLLVEIGRAAGDVRHSRQLLDTAAAHCEGALYHDLCVSTLVNIPDLHKKPLPDVVCTMINRTEHDVKTSADNCTTYLRFHRSVSSRDQQALRDCLELFDYTLDELNAAVSDVASSNNSISGGHAAHALTVLSAAMTNQQTCLDGFAYSPSEEVRSYFQEQIHHISRLVSNTLTMTKNIPAEQRADPGEHFVGYGQVVADHGFPTWVKAGDRRLLQAPVSSITPDITVSKDGSGNFTKVSDAVAAAPTNSQKRFVIYIKAGAYLENVQVGKSKKNLMFIGDGIGRTVIKASLNVVDGSTTFNSATVAVVGDGFLGRDITIENAAGPAKHQAVALRVGADLSAFYRCSFVGYQDTLYVHSLRQFFRECDVYGTIDFIFGNSAVVFQNCNLYARKPLSNQANAFTAQGRVDPNQNTGISIQNCKVAAAADLAPVQSSFKSYLGRPWQKYSRTIYMQSSIGSLIDPAGWLPWSGNFALDTLDYREYANTGPGANTANRVKWPGYHVVTDPSGATPFTVSQFIQGNQWLPSTGVPFQAGLN